ncbi:MULTISPECIES: STAS domain-containing protein [Streptomyces]|uniref:STAS domain-containing protein n=1 Tax=Streptomyces chilikensis TaxID=1194079 RepID=A0ABV3EXN7_9ACTN|nr:MULTISPECIES: STAS domain-containing protein [Streptomyces]MDH6227226.1 anti-sigma B factor antagonist [Streptomyces sp. MJP52]
MTPLTVTPGAGPGGAPLLTVAGEVDLGNAQVLARALEDTAGTVVLDLTAVEYLDSAGLSVLFAHAERLEIVVPPLLRPVVTYSGLAELAVVRAP